MSKEENQSDTRWRAYRSPHRAISHQQVHGEADDAAVPPVFAHPLVPDNDPPLITEQSALLELIDALRAAGCFAYDAEFIGEHSYELQFCLIQVATTQRVALIDTLAELDLQPFWSLLVDAQTKKIVHAGRQDFEPAARQLNQPPHNVFDTQIAAAFAGLEYPLALPKLVDSVIGADLGHAMKFSKWNERPLSNVQQRYAANDVRYLPLLYEQLFTRLDELNNAAWACQACAELSDLRLYQFDAAAQRDRIRGTGTLTPRSRAVLLSLIEWRDAEARRQDMPGRTLLKDDLLMDLAREPVRSTSDFQHRRGIPQPLKRRCADAVFEATQAGQARALPAGGCPLEPITASMRTKVNRTLRLIRQRCAERSIHVGVVTSRKKVTRLVRSAGGGRSIDQHPLMSGWRRELLEDRLAVEL